MYRRHAPNIYLAFSILALRPVDSPCIQPYTGDRLPAIS
jgi:hypothetical protein